MTDATAPLLELRDVSKSYGGVHALRNVDFAGRAGSIHAVLGENGAGKSTLMKIVSGVIRPDTGEMRLDGRPVAFASPREAVAAGVVCVFQELSLVPDLSVADNICITDPPRRFGLIDRRAQRRVAAALLDRVGCPGLDPRTRVKDLPLAQRQLVEIAKALGRNPRVLVVDEGASALSGAELARVFAVLREVRDGGALVIYISHRMNEIRELADRCSVFRNGRHVETFDAHTRGHDDIIRMMIGREMTGVFPAKPAAPRDYPPAIRVDHLSWDDRLRDIGFTIGKGEIVGLGGLDGQGQRELLLALFGVLRGVEGTVAIDGRPRRIDGPAAAKAPDIAMALIPEDRKTEGLVLAMSVADNIALSSLGGHGGGILIDRARLESDVESMVRSLQIKVGDVNRAVATLSGGNQQKVVLAKWLMTKPRILLLNDPTRGIDVGTKQEIYALLRRLADEGVAILLFSTDLAELIGCCDRVLVLYRGGIARELAGDDITEMNILGSAFDVALTGSPGPARAAGAEVRP
ncbi:sugar ABC transporter ATP-binding protein [Azospirillum sp. RWY-5-1]|uniref:Sugar ABC transporter ATP-binding protein n=1 Tax=Azospirillum oleiclasticum TaxID=2735135 RepID=A0ABX2TIS1_9PROT|nr:sugar ABC transporter ATP-binding protein [Azospirillum oleiclasticum]NYZ14422.1 sugar ABC transporter ATP-binding protein [Azospirillum oleiclasticum]NYZ23226.1 sugar ABC transporter ATP-binding protein [Azospirillum oleiclasticum]